MSNLNNFQTLRKNLTNWFTVPQSAPEINPRNFRNVQIDAIGVGLASTAAPFLPVLLARLGATTFQVTMLTFMPAVTGLLLAIPLGQFLQTRRSIVPWFSFARLAVLSSYALTALCTIFLHQAASVFGILGIWAIATVPQTVLSICFSVVMNSIAGPTGRYELMTHRWTLLGFTNAVTAFIAGQFLDKLAFPLNYQVVFISLSVGGLISYYFSSQIVLPDRPQVDHSQKHSFRDDTRHYIRQIISEKPFISFVSKRFIFLTGAALAAPLLPLYYVRTLQAPDSSIAMISIAGNTTVILGYFFWMALSRRRGSQIVLVATTFGGSLYPMLVGMTDHVWPVILYAGLNGIFQAGLNLVLFDELMKTIPVEYSATFVAAAQALQYLSSIFAPLLAPWLSQQIGFSLALVLSGGISLLGFGLFCTDMLGRTTRAKTAQEVPNDSV
jgi:hypothetical protein